MVLLIRVQRIVPCGAHTTVEQPANMDVADVYLTVPWAAIVFAQAGKPISVRVSTSRTPASMTRPSTP